jgi:hypothetical protein
MFAHAAHAMKNIPGLAAYSADLVTRAEKAWDWYIARRSNRDTEADTQEIKAGDADLSLEDQDEEEVVAAVYLYAATGRALYNDRIRDHYTVCRPWDDSWWGVWENWQGEAMMFYTTLAGAHGSVRDAVLAKRADEASWGELYRFDESQDLYRAYLPIYTWGSNQTVCDLGETVWELVEHGIDRANEGRHRERCLGLLHYLHGVNPQGIVYLSNMYEHGAERSANRIFHTWFKPGTRWSDARTGDGPAPGYLAGGPNQYHTGDLVVAGTTSLIRDQPPQKAYSDENSGFGIWEITEPAIYYQAAYIQLLSNFVRPAAVTRTEVDRTVGDRRAGATQDAAVRSAVGAYRTQ